MLPAVRCWVSSSDQAPQIYGSFLGYRVGFDTAGRQRYNVYGQWDTRLEGLHEVAQLSVLVLGTCPGALGDVLLLLVLAWTPGTFLKVADTVMTMSTSGLDNGLLPLPLAVESLFVLVLAALLVPLVVGMVSALTALHDPMSAPKPGLKAN